MDTKEKKGINTNSNVYTIAYAAIMVIIVAFVLSLTAQVLKPKQTANVELDKKKQILSSLRIDFKGKDVEKIYGEIVKQDLVINGDGQIISEKGGFAIESKKASTKALPLFVCSIDGKTKYVASMYGKGLWGPIWGYISLNADFNTVYGAYFSHAGETPGLGAEITTPKFKGQFINKKILNKSGEFVSIAIVKQGKVAEGKDYVNGIAGGTMTSKGVDNMLMQSLGMYKNFIKNKKGE